MYYIVYVEHFYYMHFLPFIFMLMSGIEYDSKEPLHTNLFGSLFGLTWTIDIILGLQRKKINIIKLIGKAKDIRWLELIGLSIALVFLQKGCFRVLYYFILSEIPELFEYININRTILEMQKSSFPNSYLISYYLLLELFIFPVLFTLLSIIFLYKLEAKIGNHLSKWLFIGILPLISLIYLFATNFNAFFSASWLVWILSIISFLPTALHYTVYLQLYFKYKSLISLTVFLYLFQIINLLYSIFVSHHPYFLKSQNPIEYYGSLDNFRFQLPLGIIMLICSAPYLIYWIYKHRNYLKRELPYFAD